MASKWRWVSRDDGEDTVCIWDGKDKPEAFDGIFDALDSFVGVRNAGFLSLFGIDIQPGQCVKVEFTAKVLE